MRKLPSAVVCFKRYSAGEDASACAYPCPQSLPYPAALWWLWRETRHYVDRAGMDGQPTARSYAVVADVADRAGVPWDAEAIVYFNVFHDFWAKHQEKQRAKESDKQPGGTIGNYSGR